MSIQFQMSIKQHFWIQFIVHTPYRLCHCCWLSKLVKNNLKKRCQNVKEFSRIFFWHGENINCEGIFPFQASTKFDFSTLIKYLA